MFLTSLMFAALRGQLLELCFHSIRPLRMGQVGPNFEKGVNHSRSYSAISATYRFPFIQKIEWRNKLCYALYNFAMPSLTLLISSSIRINGNSK